MPSIGPLNPSASEANGWNNAPGAYINDAAYATMSLPQAYKSGIIKFTGFKFALPPCAIDGVLFEVKRKKSGPGGPISDVLVGMIVGGTVRGINYSSGLGWNPVESYIPFGGPDSKWGLMLTDGDLNDPMFGVALQCKNDDVVLLTAWINHVRCTAWYTPT